MAAFDTGSSNTWVLSAEASPAGAKNNGPWRQTGRQQGKSKAKTGFFPSKSKTTHKTDQEAQVNFGSGAIAGHFYIDELRFGSKCD